MDGWYGFPQDCARKQGVKRSIFVVWHASSSRGFDDDGAMSTRCFSFRCNLADQLQAESSMRSRTMARIMLEQQQQHQPLFDSSHFELVTKCVMICHNMSRCDQTWHSNPQPSRPVCHPHHLTLLGRSNNRRWFEMGVVYSTCTRKKLNKKNHRPHPLNLLPNSNETFPSFLHTSIQPLIRTQPRHSHVLENLSTH